MKNIFAILVMCFSLPFIGCDDKKNSDNNGEGDRGVLTTNDLNSQEKTTFLHVRHSPLHPQDKKPINFSVKAKNKDGIRKINLEIFEHALTEDAKKGRVITRRQNGRWGQVSTRNYADVKEVSDSFLFEEGFPQGTYLIYRFTIESAKGVKVSRDVRMQAGTSPFGNKEVLIYSASADIPSRTFNLCFIPSKQHYASKTAAFLKDLETTLYEGILSSNMVVNRSDEWAFYYTPETADVGLTTENKVILPKYLPSVLKGSPLDIYAYIHNYAQCRDKKVGKRFSTEFDSRGTIMHEIGHAAFSLSDEYNNSTSADKSCNVYTDAALCKTKNNGKDCRVFNKWVKVKGGPDIKLKRFSFDTLTPNCVMRKDGDEVSQPYQKKCMSCIEAKYTKLNNRSGKSVIVNPGANPTFQLEEVVLIKLVIDQSGWKAVELEGAFSTPTLDLQEEGDLKVSLLGPDKKSFHTLNVDDPRISYIDEGPEDNELEIEDEGELIIRLPYGQDVKFLTIQEITIDGKQKLTQIDITNQISKLKSSFATPPTK
ncbi:hypothetical protein BEN47_15280 [Hymenobacter lapidarius]|uniref:Uncharacterized protein n=1 Tax=Hymenobacter lapidarius TaxID=1908237 RepID=A0A1G1T2H3_9BACT|nr:hypothetical protein [Hymenobacter lapidarius]OGX85078.1 hypothetical protein BEN47_15280 [Hymenobacter lapidarius]